MHHLTLFEVGEIGDVVVARYGALTGAGVVAQELLDGILNEELLVKANGALL